MTFALNSIDHFNADQDGAAWVLPAGTFTGLDSADRQVLSNWLDGADGIDTVMDFSARPWNVSGTSIIIGVFKPGQDQATWLVVREGQEWIMARCADGFISDASISLIDVLRLIEQDAGA